MGWIVGTRVHLVTLAWTTAVACARSLVPLRCEVLVVFVLRVWCLLGVLFLALARIWCSQFNRFWLRTGALLRIFVYRGRVTIEFASPHLPQCASRCLTCHRFDAVPCGSFVAEFAGEVVVALIVVIKEYGAEGGHHEPVSAATRWTSQSGAYL